MPVSLLQRQPLRSSAWRRLLQRRPNTYKGDYGHLLVVAGSIGFTGAPVLCALGALRSGAGLVSLSVPESIYFIVASQLREVMTHPFPETPKGSFSLSALAVLRPLLERADVLAVGPGLSRELSTGRFVQELLLKTRQPVVLDADGVAAFSGSASSRRKLRKARGRLVLTPHPGEMSRLLGVSVGKVQRGRREVALSVAKELGAVVVLKGHRTVVASPKGQVYLNSTGNPGMASGGVGDALTGMIAALIGQGLDPFSAARAGVYLHGLAGDLAAKKVGEVSMTAGDLLDSVPAAFLRAAKR
ncbi:MAG: NAD(P)H-hydrate dehydratase [Candidatus Omnitrophica bacterium]|nr:NAD(P)H-hydrate dehydratase [Candidatus Omnitrophota bacterium]